MSYHHDAMSHPGPRTSAAHCSRRSLLVICFALSGCVSGHCPGGSDSAPRVCESGSEKITNTLQPTTPAPVVVYSVRVHRVNDSRPVSGRVVYPPHGGFPRHPLTPRTPLQNGVAPQGAPAADPPASSKVPALSPPEGVLSRTPLNVDAATK